MTEAIAGSASPLAASCGHEANHCGPCPYSTGRSIGGYDIVSSGDEFRKILTEIFTDDFIRSNTNFESFEGFKYSSAVIVDWNRDTLIYDRYLLDHFVRESTRFAAWEEMVKAAADERYAVNNAEK